MLPNAGCEEDMLGNGKTKIDEPDEKIEELGMESERNDRSCVNNSL